MTGKWVEFTNIVGAKVSLRVDSIIGFEEKHIGENPDTKYVIKPGDPFTVVYTNNNWFEEVIATYAEVKQAIEEN